MVFYHLRQRSCALKQLYLMPRWKTLSRVGMLIATVAIGVLLAFIPRVVRSQPQLVVSNSTPAITVNSLESTPSLLPSPKPTGVHIVDSSSDKQIEAQTKIQNDAQALPPIPYEDFGACPYGYGCCPYGEWTVEKEAVLHKYRSNDSPVVFTVKPQEKVQALTGVVVTITPGEVRIVRPITIEFYDINSDTPQTIQAQPGDIVYLLTYDEGGVFKAWFKGRFMFVNALDLREENQPGYIDKNNGSLGGGKSIWWVEIKNSQGQIGWTDQGEAVFGQFLSNHACDRSS